MGFRLLQGLPFKDEVSVPVPIPPKPQHIRYTNPCWVLLIIKQKSRNQYPEYNVKDIQSDFKAMGPA